MFKTITAKFPGTCKRCKTPIDVGMTIRYGGRGQTYHLKAACPVEPGTSSPATDDDAIAVAYENRQRSGDADFGHAPDIDFLNGY